MQPNKIKKMISEKSAVKGVSVDPRCAAPCCATAASTVTTNPHRPPSTPSTSRTLVTSNRTFRVANRASSLPSITMSTWKCSGLCLPTPCGAIKLLNLLFLCSQEFGETQGKVEGRRPMSPRTRDGNLHRPVRVASFSGRRQQRAGQSVNHASHHHILKSARSSNPG